MIDTKALRQKILDLAFQGKLTEQLPEDGTGEELFQQIQQEKRKLEAEGKIKKEKSLPPVSEDEIPFDIPDNWKWVRFSDAYALTNGLASRGIVNGNPHPVLRLADLAEGKIRKEGIRLLNLSDNEFQSHQVTHDDLVFIRVNGSKEKVAKAFHYEGKTPISYCDHLFCGHRISLHVFVKYWLYVFKSQWMNKQLSSEIKTTAGQNTISQSSMAKAIIPLPPLAEQKRIVEKIEAVLSLLENIDNLQNHYSSNKLTLKSKLIDAAIQGKLTQQLPEDGTAEELYQQIQQEKRKLEAEGKIKKAKVLPPVSEDEIPFDIPDNWKWIRLSELGIFSGGKTPSMDNKDYWNNGTINWITSKDMKRKYINSSEMKITKEGAAELSVYPTKTILFVVRSGILRRSFPVAILTDQGTINQDLKALGLFVSDMCEYIYFVLKGLESKILFRYTKDGTTVNNIMFDEFLTMPIPLPPLAEQKRIVAKLEELLPLCE